MNEASKSCADGGERVPPSLFVASGLELAFTLALGLTNTGMLTTVGRME
jgi:hypothetical protein